MHNLNHFPHKNPSKQGQGCRKGGQAILICHGDKWTIINLDSGHQVAYTLSVAVGMSDNDHLVAESPQALRQGPNMHFHSTQSRIEEITDQRHSVEMTSSWSLPHSSLVIFPRLIYLHFDGRNMWMIQPNIFF
jgi:hypothetical protein